jgi:hypothetical protein
MHVGFVKGATRGSEGHASFDRTRVVAPERVQLVDDEPLETGSGDDERVILRSRAHGRNLHDHLRADFDALQVG